MYPFVGCSKWVDQCGHAFFMGCLPSARGENEDSNNDKGLETLAKHGNDDYNCVASKASKSKAKSGEKSFPPPAGLKGRKCKTLYLTFASSFFSCYVRFRFQGRLEQV
jgi:hypothetical protein